MVMNPILEKRMLMLICQSYAVSYEELFEVYTELQSIDKILEVIAVYKEVNTTLTNAYSNWKANETR